MHINVCSLSNKIPELGLALTQWQHAPEVLVIGEHWLSSQNVQHASLDGYELSSSFCRPDSHRGGGVLILAKEGIQHTPITCVDQFSKEGDYEVCGSVVALHSDRKLAVIGVYRSPSGDLPTFLDRAERTLCALNHHDEIIVLGDFNAPFNHMDRRARQIEQMYLQNGFTRVISQPTRGLNCLDNIFVKGTENVKSSGVLKMSLSDHNAVFVNMALKPAVEDDHVMRRNFTSENTQLLLDSLLREDWTFAAQDIPYEDKWKILIERINRHIEATVPLKKIKTRKPSKRISSNWTTAEIILKKEHVADLKNFHECIGTEASKVAYIAGRNRLREMIKKATIDANSDSIKAATNSSRAMWRFINSRRGKGKNRGKQEAETPSVDELEKYFNNIAKTLESKLPPAQSDPIANMKPATDQNIPRLNIHTVSEREIARAIRNLKGTTTPDCYGMTCVVLKRISPAILAPLHFLINEGITLGTFPQHLKKTRIVAIFKSGDKSDPANYRPISILPILSKVYESVVKRQIEQHFETNELFTKHQHGFRKAHSTEAAILDFSNRVLKGFQNNQYVAASFFDVSKGFDCVPHPILLRKLAHYGMRGTSLNLLKSYLGQRGTNEYGVPQGSILGPIIFIIFSNDIPDYVDPATCDMYADDNTCTTMHKCYNQVIANSAAAENTMKEWMTMNRMTLNDSKTVKMTLSLRDLSMVTNPISAKMLGVQIDPLMTWEHHCTQLCRILSGTVFLLKQLSFIVNSATLKAAYYGVFHSKMQYGILAWGHSVHAGSVFAIQRRAVRVVARKGYREECRGIFDDLEIPTLYAVYATKCAMHAIENQELIPPQHAHATRFAENNIAISHNRLTRAQNSSNYWAAKIWNKLPDELKAQVANNTTANRQKLRKHFSRLIPFALSELV